MMMEAQDLERDLRNLDQLEASRLGRNTNPARLPYPDGVDRCGSEMPGGG